MKHFALIGNPNSGKTTLFNSLTGSTAHVGNWPGVTVDKREGKYKLGKNEISIVDLPGIYSLSPYTPEEVITRNYLLEGEPDGIINIVDATNLERNLYLTTQLLEINIPIVIALNMMDEVRKNGDFIDTTSLSDALGIPVIEISALKEDNLDELMNKAYEVSLKKRQGKSILFESSIGELLTKINGEYCKKEIDNPLFHSIKLMELDELETRENDDLVKYIQEYKDNHEDNVFFNDFEAIIADERYKYISSHYSIFKKKSKRKETNTEKIDRVLTHKWAGIPIFLLILFTIFHLTFSENLFFLGFIFKMNNIAPSFTGTYYEGLFWTENGINSPGIMLSTLVNSTSSLISDSIQSLLPSNAWYSSFIIDGVLAGIFSIMSFLPQILLLFLFFSILEDSGYMARIAFILDRILRKFGLSGRAFMPLIMGFGCSVPAMINTRTLIDENERIATIRVIPFFSCGAKLPILTAISGGLVLYFGIGNADLITYSMYLLGIITAFISIIIMRKTSMKGSITPFIMELPSYRFPKFQSLILLLWDKMKHFIHKAFTLILASTIIIWFLTNFNWTFSMCEMNNSILSSIGKFIQPIFTPLGFGSQLSSFGWVFAVSIITGLIAKENVVATFYTLASCIVSSKLGISNEIKEIFSLLNEGNALSIVREIIITSQEINSSSLLALKELLDDSLVPSEVINEIILNLSNNNLDKSLYSYLSYISLEEESINNIISCANTLVSSGTKDEIINNVNIILSTSTNESLSLISLINATAITPAALISFIAFNMTTVPCVAACATAKGELPKGKFYKTILFWIFASYIISSSIYLMLSWWWTSFIIFGILILLFVILKEKNKKGYAL